MKRFVLFVLCVMSLGTTFAQDPDDRDHRSSNRVRSEALEPQVFLNRYLVSYLKSRADVPRSATVVTVINQSINQSKESCGVRVSWFAGFEPETPACTSTEILSPGVSHDFCSRDLLNNITTCNSICSPELTFIEGKAIVSSSASTECSLIRVGARLYYTTGDLSDTGVAAVSDPKVVRIRRQK